MCKCLASIVKIPKKATTKIKYNAKKILCREEMNSWMLFGELLRPFYRVPMVVAAVKIEDSWVVLIGQDWRRESPSFSLKPNLELIFF